MKKLSIITINLNNKAGLEKTIRSVIEQTFSDYEFIIIDGGSTDGSVDTIKKYSSVITYWISEKDTGIYNAMNKGIVNAKGNYCLFLNSGDFLLKDVLNKIFKTNLSSDIVYCDLIFDLGENGIQYRSAPNPLSFYFMFIDSLFHPSTFIRKKLFNSIGMYNEEFKIAGDYDFFFNAIVKQQVSCQYFSIAVAQYNVKGISSQPENSSTIAHERLKVHKEYLSPMILEEMNNYVALQNLSDYKYLNLIKTIPFLWKSIQIIAQILLKIKGRKK